MRHARCAQVSTNIALVKNATLHGVFWGSYMQHRPRVLRRSLEQLIAWLGEGRISIPIFHRRACLLSACSSGQGRISAPTFHGRACSHTGYSLVQSRDQLQACAVRDAGGCWMPGKISPQAQFHLQWHVLTSSFKG